MPCYPIFRSLSSSLSNASSAKTPEAELWGTRYFTEAWQNFFDIFNSVPLILISIRDRVLPLKLRSDHHLRRESADPLRFRLPDTFTTTDTTNSTHSPDFIFESPISYWDRDHYAGIVAPIEQIVILAAAIYLFPRLKTRLARGCLVIVNILFVASYLLF